MGENQPQQYISDVPEGENTLELSEHQNVRRWLVSRSSNVWSPPTDVFELEDRLVVMIEIAGMRDSEFSVVLNDRRLTVSGVRARVIRERMAYHQMEIRYGEFRCEVGLPWPVDREQVGATYRDGFLRVELPRARNQQIRIVDVEQGTDS